MTVVEEPSTCDIYLQDDLGSATAGGLPTWQFLDDATYRIFLGTNLTLSGAALSSEKTLSIRGVNAPYNYLMGSFKYTAASTDASLVLTMLTLLDAQVEIEAQNSLDSSTFTITDATIIHTGQNPSASEQDIFTFSNPGTPSPAGLDIWLQRVKLSIPAPISTARSSLISTTKLHTGLTNVRIYLIDCVHIDPEQPITATSLVYTASPQLQLTLIRSKLLLQGESLVSTSSSVPSSAITMTNSTLNTTADLPQIYAQSTPNTFELRLTNGIIAGWRILDARISSTNNDSPASREPTSYIINCRLSVSSVTESLIIDANSTLHILLDDNIDPPPPPRAAVKFSASLSQSFLIYPFSSLVFSSSSSHSNSYYYIGNNITIETIGDGSCDWMANRLTLAPFSSIQTLCNLHLTQGLDGGNERSMIAGMSIESNSTLPSLDVGHVNAYNGAFRFETFSDVTFHMPPRSTLGQPLVPVMRPSVASVLAITGPPDGHTIIKWDNQGIAPSQNVLYPLYTISSGAISNPIELAPPLPPQNHEFEVLYTPTSGTATSVSARLVGSFDCIVQSGVCTANGSISQPTLILPPNQQVFVINGNLTTSTITYVGIGSIVIKGCVDPSLKNIEVILTQEDIKKLEKAEKNKITVSLITVDSSGNSCQATDLSLIKVSASLKGSGCKRVKLSTSSTSKTVTAVFTLDTSKCNIWWIVLASVLGGLLVIAVLVVVLLVIFVPSVRHKVRPYSKKRAAASTSK